MAKKNSNKRVGHKVNPSYSYGGQIVKNVRELDAAIRLAASERLVQTQEWLDGNMRMLLTHLEEGSVYYVTEVAIPSAYENKQPTTLITLKTLSKNEEKLWAVHHDPKSPYSWKAECICRSGAFGTFRIYSCDTVKMIC